MGELHRLADRGPGEARRQRRTVSFDRRELGQLLDLYSRRVSSGEWRDYAIDFRPGRAVFSIFRHAAERPLFAIAKAPGARGATGSRLPLWSVWRGPQRVVQGEELADVLEAFDRRLRVMAG